MAQIYHYFYSNIQNLIDMVDDIICLMNKKMFALALNIQRQNRLKLNDPKKDNVLNKRIVFLNIHALKSSVYFSCNNVVP